MRGKPMDHKLEILKSKADRIKHALKCCSLGHCDVCTYSGGCVKGEGHSREDTLILDTLDVIEDYEQILEYYIRMNDSIDKFCRDLCNNRELEGKPVADFETLLTYIENEKNKAVRDALPGEVLNRIRESYIQKVKDKFIEEGIIPKKYLDSDPDTELLDVGQHWY